MSGRLLALLCALAVLGGCATKRDLKDLRAEMQATREQQEALLREIQRQTAAILDSLNVQEVRLRGDLTNQLVQMERQLLQIQELTGQGQQQLADLRRTIREREEAVRAMEVGDSPPAGAAGNPDELFETARSALERGSLTAARAGFEEFVRVFPQHARAAEAQLGVAQTYEEEDPARALEAYGRVLELYPNSPQAPTALYRAALLEIERDNEDRARSMLSQVTAAYPRSPEAELAREELRRLR